MKLREYLDKEHMSVSAFATLISVHKNFVFMILNGQRRPSIDVARHIQFVTKGEVTVDDVIPLKPICEFCHACGKKLIES